MNLLATTRWLGLHRKLLADRHRTESYQRAIRRVVRPGDVVLDLGTGSGILAYFACQAGAKKVYAVELDRQTVEMAKQISPRNPYNGRIIFLNKHSYRTRLPERADVLVTETLGNFGLEEGILGALLDARKRLLKKGGRIIPRKVELWVSPVEFPDGYEKVDFWDHPRYGINFTSVRMLAANQIYPVRLEPHHCLSRPGLVTRLDLEKIKDSSVRGELFFRIKKRGCLHGLGGWFSAELCPGIRLSNAPPNRFPSWGNMFFPIETSLRLKENDFLKVRVWSTKNGSVLSWEVDCTRHKMRFNHSSFFGLPWKRVLLRKEGARSHSGGRI